MGVWRRGFWFAAGLGALLAVSAPLAWAEPPAAAEPPQPDCEYMPGDGTIASNRWANAPAMYLDIDGCEARCVARVYCRSDNPKLEKLAGGPTISQKYGASRWLMCEPNPMVDGETPSCRPAAECVAMAKQHKAKYGVSVRPGGGRAMYVRGDGAVFEHVKYGVDYRIPDNERTVGLFQLPPSKGTPAGSCNICASPVTLDVHAYAGVACHARAGGCANANECISEWADHSDQLSVMPVTAANIQHVEPEVLQADASPAGAPTDTRGARAPGGTKK